VLHLSREVFMSKVRTMRWPKNCCRCNTEMEPGTPLVEDETQEGPRGGALFRHAVASQCRKPNPRYERSPFAGAPMRSVSNPFGSFDPPPDARSRAQGEAMLRMGSRRWNR